jgi:hypothetical protein
VTFSILNDLFALIRHIVAPIAEEERPTNFCLHIPHRISPHPMTTGCEGAHRTTTLKFYNAKCLRSANHLRLDAVLTRLPSEVVQILMSMSEGSEDGRMRNEPTRGHFPLPRRFAQHELGIGIKSFHYHTWIGFVPHTARRSLPCTYTGPRALDA